MEKYITSGWAGLLKRFFYRQERLCAAIVPTEDGACSLLCYSREEDCWQLAEESISQGENQFAEEGLEDDEGLSLLERQADWVVMELARKGWQRAELIYVIPAQEIIGYALSLPPNLTPAQQAEAAYWELDERLAARGLSAEAFACLCEPIGQEQTGNPCMIIGVRQAYLQEVQAVFRNAGLTLADIIPGGENQETRSLLERYLSKMGERRGFCRRRTVQLDWQHIAACWLGLFIAVISLWAGLDIYGYEQAKLAAQAQRAELVRLAPERQEMLAAEAQCQRIEARERLLQEMQGKGTQWYSVLVHLGANTREGVYITRMMNGNDGRSLILEGQAVSYDALAEFVDGLEQDRDFFPQGVILHDSEVKEKVGNVKFSLTINWENQTNEEDAAGKVEPI